MNYTLIFDIRQSGYRHWMEVSCAAVALIMAMAFLCQKLRFGWRPSAKDMPMALFAGVSILIAVSMSAFTYRDYLRLNSAMRQSQCQIAEGVVTQFRPSTRHAAASFAVNGDRFRFKEGSLESGFNQGGIIRDGLQVRIYYFHDDIARLEIAW